MYIYREREMTKYTSSAKKKSTKRSIFVHFKILTDYNLKLVIVVENRYQCPKTADDKQDGYFFITTVSMF